MNLKELRLARGITQEQLAKACGLDQTQISRYESGVFEPNLETLRKLAAVLGCTLDELIGTNQDAERAG